MLETFANVHWRRKEENLHTEISDDRKSQLFEEVENEQIFWKFVTIRVWLF